ncbi:MAG: hypothetical protein KDD47_16595 [Acidobacteria bacterium]|nr:hypothetical protein [Acidobacteriota bacterium]
MNDRILIAILGGIAALGLGLYLAWGGGSEPKFERVQSLELDAVLTPTRDATDGVDASVAGTETARRLRIYVDVSESMAGYLDPAAGTSGFRAVSLLVPDHLLRLYGPIESVRWTAVDDALHELGEAPAFRPGDFRGAETYLDLAVEEGFGLLAEGKIEAFALITDLVATREVSGALGLYNAIREWLLASGVRNGDLEFGLLGVKVPFRGVANGKCQQAGDLGCWFSERSRAWRPLSEVVSRPFYVLVFGRSGFGERTGDAGESLVQQAGAALLKDTGRLGFESHWELLTRLARPQPAVLRCGAEGEDGKEQFALLRKPSGRFRCQQDQQVFFRCGLDPLPSSHSDPLPVKFALTAAILSWEKDLISTMVENGSVDLELDCGRVREQAPAEPLVFTSLVAAPETPEDSDPWTEWSVESDEQEAFLDRTLQLRHFVAGTRPARYEVQVEDPLLGERP